jgi:hypothetical protein
MGFMWYLLGHVYHLTKSKYKSEIFPQKNQKPESMQID